MRLEQLRELNGELDLVRPSTCAQGFGPGGGRERQIYLQESDRLLLLQGIRETAVALAHAASPVESAKLDPAAAAQMRLIAKKVVANEVLQPDEASLWADKRPHAIMRLNGVQRLKAELEALERRVKGLRVPDDDDMIHQALVDPVPAEQTGQHRVWKNTAAAVPFGGFELLRERRSERPFKGENMQASNQMFVDFSTRTPHA